MAEMNGTKLPADQPKDSTEEFHNNKMEGSAYRFYENMVANMNREVQATPGLQYTQVVAVLAKLTGFGIGAISPPQQAVAREMAIRNLDLALKETSDRIAAERLKQALKNGQGNAKA